MEFKAPDYWHKNKKKHAVEDLLNDPEPLLRKYGKKLVPLAKKARKGEITKKQLDKEKHKIREQFYKELIKKYPKEKKKLLKLKKENINRYK